MRSLISHFRKFQASRRGWRQRNLRLSILDGILVKLGMNLSHPNMVLTVLVRALGGSNTLVGALSTIRFSGWLLPQFLIAGWIQPLSRKVPFVSVTAFIRTVIYGVLAVLVYTLGRANHSLLLALFLALFALSRVITGASGLARYDVFGSVVSPAQRASFFATRNFWGGVFVFGAGFLVRLMLDSEQGMPFPGNFSVLLLVSCVFFLIDSVIFAMIKEPHVRPNQAGYSIAEQLGRVPELLKRDSTLRRYLLVRVLLSMTMVAQPFYSVFALDILEAPEFMVGFYLSAMTLANVIANLLWRRLERARGTLYLMKAASCLSALAPLLAAATPWLMQAVGISTRGNGILPAYLFSIVFMIAGGSQSGRGVSLPAVLLDIAPAEERPSYVGLVNTVLGVINFLPMLSGFAIDIFGFEPVFLITGVMLLVGFWVSRRLPNRSEAQTALV